MWLESLILYEEEEGLSRRGQGNSLNICFVTEAQVSGDVCASPLCARSDLPLLG